MNKSNQIVIIPEGFDVLKREKQMERKKGEIKVGRHGLDDFIIMEGCEAVQAPGNSWKECRTNAEHLVKCWNAFEEGGLVTDLLDACEAANLTLRACTKHLLGTGPIPEPEATALTIIQIKEAIAKAEKEMKDE